MTERISEPGVEARRANVGLHARFRRLGTLARQRPLGVASAFLLALVAIVAVLAPLIAPYDPYRVAPLERLHAPSLKHWLGTDEVGRDFFSRIVYGSRISLLVGIATVGLGLSAATAIGILSGFFGGKIDLVIQRVMDALQTIPGIVLALVLMSLFGTGLTKVMVALSIVVVPFNQRVVRASVLSLKEEVFVDAARAIGASSRRILMAHVLPNIVAPILILASLLFGYAIIAEAALSFLGLGSPPPTPSWGLMLSGAGKEHMEDAPFLSIFPGLAITLVVLSFNLLGDALRDIWDPKLRGR